MSRALSNLNIELLFFSFWIKAVDSICFTQITLNFNRTEGKKKMHLKQTHGCLSKAVKLTKVQSFCKLIKSQI